jgi:hypothetical protein
MSSHPESMRLTPGTRPRLVLPGWLAPRDGERKGRGRQRRIESVVLLIAAVMLCVATVNDLVREVGIGDRLAADLSSWKRIVGNTFPHPALNNPLIEQNIKTYTTRDVVCANTEPKVAPEHRVQVCLVFTGPVHGERREAHGGYYLWADGTDEHKPVLNEPRYSYGCVGTAVGEGLCELKGPPAGALNKPDEPISLG